LGGLLTIIFTTNTPSSERAAEILFLKNVPCGVGRKIVFGLFKSNPSKKMRKEYDQLLERAMLAQRKGDIKTYSMLTAESEELWKKIEEVEKQQ
jgi:hypothetical protein